MNAVLRKILEQRQKQYGDFKEVAKTSQSIKAQYEYKQAGLPNFVRESLDMIANKLGRIINGDWKHKDSWVDIQGYAQLVIDEIENIIEDETENENR